MASPLTADPTAVFGRRVVAAVIDSAVVLVPGGAIATSQMEYITRDRVGSGFDEFCTTYIEQQGGSCFQLGDRAYFNDDTASVASLAVPGLALLLFVVVQGLTGWTVGKLLTGIRTVREDGRAPGIGKALVRWLLFVADGPCQPFVPIVGGVCALTTQGHRRVGDMAAKTFVVRRSAAGAPIVVPGMTAPAPPPLAAQPGSWGTPSPAGPGAPQWDAARGTYIQWDPALARWMQWDEAAHSWSPIPGQ